MPASIKERRATLSRAPCSFIASGKSGTGPSKTSATALNLAVAAIILWNTIYLGRAVDELRSRGEIIPDEILAHAAPLGWEHIAFNGDYVWPHDALETFRPLRNPRAEFLDAA